MKRKVGDDELNKEMENLLKEIKSLKTEEMLNIC